MSHRRASGGFTLIEMMVATAVFSLLLAGTVTASVYLNRRGQMEELSSTTLQGGTFVADLMTPAVMEAGAGLGGTRITFADGDYRYGIDVSPAAGAPYGAFASDTRTYGSDILRLYWGQVEGSVPLKECNATTTSAFASTNVFCIGTPRVRPFNQGDNVFFANPDRVVSCVAKVRNYQGPGSNPAQLTVIPGATGSVSAIDTCGSGIDPFWSLNNASHPSVLLARSLGFRVAWGDANYPSSVPLLQMESDQDFTAGSGGGPAWTTVAKNVESLHVFLGVGPLNTLDTIQTANPNPNPDLVWFPDYDAAGVQLHPYVSQCTFAQSGAGGVCAVPDTYTDGGLGLSTNDQSLPYPGSSVVADDRLRFQLMRRVRAVRIQITSRSDREDRDAPDSGMGRASAGPPAMGTV